MPPANHTVEYELRDAMAGEGCAICGLALRSLSRYMESLAYESINNIALRAELRAARGFCAVHGQMLREARSALGTAIIHRDIVGALGSALEGMARPAGGGFLGRLLGGDVANPLLPQTGCPACARRREAEQIYVDTLAKRADDDGLIAAYTASAGLCLPHLRATLGRAPNAAAFDRLRVAQRAIWSRLTAELDEFIRKHDHQFANEPVGPEGNAWSRASLLVSCHPLLGRGHSEE